MNRAHYVSLVWIGGLIGAAICVVELGWLACLGIILCTFSSTVFIGLE
jgi:hypothetical protein